jgi:hypothetical protein
VTDITDKDFLEHILLLMEDPDDGWIEERICHREVELRHVPSDLRLRVRGRKVVLLIAVNPRRENARSRVVEWKPKGFIFGAWRRRRLRKAVDTLRDHLVFAPIRDALDPEYVHLDEPGDDPMDDEEFGKHFLDE